MDAPDSAGISEQAIQTIYCDESGFTGTRLSDKDQPHFVYASVAVTPHRASEIVTETRQRFRIEGQEIKGNSLVKFARGRRAISFLLDTCLKDSQCVVINTQYALACKLYEYIFEPVLKNKGVLFYRLGFNRFIANLLFSELRTADTFDGS
ncbi:MAG: DUF3800 domain-containing protein [Candidatus Sulfotelmatobacter sp.]